MCAFYHIGFNLLSNRAVKLKMIHTGRSNLCFVLTFRTYSTPKECLFSESQNSSTTKAPAKIRNGQVLHQNYVISCSEHFVLLQNHDILWKARVKAENSLLGIKAHQNVPSHYQQNEGPSTTYGGAPAKVNLTNFKALPINI